MRQDLLINNGVYHILNKSIAGYTIFNNDIEFSRMLNIIQYYLIENPSVCYSRFIKLSQQDQELILLGNHKKEKIVQIIAYCLMPTHFHLILQQLISNGISRYIANISNSYSRYFNIKHKRQGPLWQGKFKNVLVNDDKQLLHLTRYIHLNPTTAGIVSDPIDWQYSSYNEYLKPNKNNLCNYNDILDIKSGVYQRFVLSQKDYQSKLSIIKKHLLD
jgi:putative transposase